jgi:hypothetical protein
MVYSGFRAERKNKNYNDTNKTVLKTNGTCVCVACSCRKYLMAIFASTIVAMLNKQMVHKSSSLMMT